jgi:hypothetical protein
VADRSDRIVWGRSIGAMLPVADRRRSIMPQNAQLVDPNADRRADVVMRGALDCGSGVPCQVHMRPMPLATPT